MKFSKSRLLTITLLLVGPVHQRLVSVSAQEDSVAYEVVEEANQELAQDIDVIEIQDTNSTEMIHEDTTEAIKNDEEDTEALIVDDSMDTPEKSETAAEAEVEEIEDDYPVTEKETLQSNETIDSPENETRQTYVSLSDVEKELGHSIYNLVNDLREINGLNRLEYNESLQTAAKELVEKQPISDEFVNKYGDSHSLDTSTAQKNGYHADFVPANHAYTQLKTEDIAKLDLKTLASTFVNKWYLDVSDSDKAHRKQMLTQGWQETGINVSILPRIFVGEYKNQFLRNKFGDTLLNQATLQLNDGFDIHVSQFFGSKASKVDYSQPKETLSLQNYSDYVADQVGLEEYNPMTGNKVALTQEESVIEKSRQAKINNKHTDKYQLIQEEHDTLGEFTDDQIINHLISTKKSLDINDMDSALQENIEEILLDERIENKPSNQTILEIIKDGKTLANMKVIYQNDQVNLHPYTKTNNTPTIKDKEFSMKESNIFADKNDAIEYGESVVSENSDYRYILVEMNDGQYSVWFPKKEIMPDGVMVMVSRTRDYYGAVEALLYDLKKMYKDFDADIVSSGYISDRGGFESYTLKVKDTTPISFEDNIDLNNIGIFNNDNYFSPNWFGKYLALDYREEYDFHYWSNASWVDIPHDAKYFGEVSYPSKDMIYRVRNIEGPIYDSRESARKAGEMVAPPGFSVSVISNSINQYSYELYPSIMDDLSEERFYSIEEVNKELRRLPSDYTYSVHRFNASETNPYTFYRITLSQSTSRSLIDKANSYVYKYLDQLNEETQRYVNGTPHRYDIFKLGDMYSASIHSPFDPHHRLEEAYHSFEEAKKAASKFIEENPSYYYDIFKVDETYIVRLAENRIDTRWTPDSMHYNSKSEADSFAQYVSTLVREYEYEVVPDRNGFYTINTLKIVYHDDQDGLNLIPEYIGSGNSGILGQNYTYNNITLTDIYEKYRISKPAPSDDKQPKPNEEENNPKPDVKDPEKPGAQDQEQPSIPSDSDQVFKEVEEPIADWLVLPTVSAQEVTDKPSTTINDQNEVSTMSVNNYTQEEVTTASVNNFAQEEVLSSQIATSYFNRIRAILSDLSLDKILKVIIVDLFEDEAINTSDLSEKFDLLYNISLIYRDLNQASIDEPIKVEVILLAEEEVDEVLIYDEEAQEVTGELNFTIEERSLDELEVDLNQLDERAVNEGKVRVLVFEIIQEGTYGINFVE